MKPPLARYLDEGTMRPLDLREAVLAGLPAREVVRFVSSFKSIPRSQLLAALKLNESMLQRLSDAKLPPSASGAALDLGRVLRSAIGVLGSVEEAERWLSEPAIAFRGDGPLDLLATRQGTQVVFDQLVRMDHDVYV